VGGDKRGTCGVAQNEAMFIRPMGVNVKPVKMTEQKKYPTEGKEKDVFKKKRERGSGRKDWGPTLSVGAKANLVTDQKKRGGKGIR